MADVIKPVLLDDTGKEIVDAIKDLQEATKNKNYVYEVFELKPDGTVGCSLTRWSVDSEGGTYNKRAYIPYIPHTARELADYNQLVKASDISPAAKTGSYNTLKDIPMVTTDFKGTVGIDKEPTQEHLLVDKINFTDLLGMTDLSKVMSSDTISLENNPTVKGLLEDVDELEDATSRIQNTITDPVIGIVPNLTKQGHIIEDLVEKVGDDTTPEGLIYKVKAIEDFDADTVGEKAVLPKPDMTIAENVKDLYDNMQYQLNTKAGLMFDGNRRDIRLVEWSKDGQGQGNVTGLSFINMNPDSEGLFAIGLNTKRYSSDTEAESYRAAIDINENNEVEFRPERVNVENLKDGSDYKKLEYIEENFQHILPTPVAGQNNYSLVVKLQQGENPEDANHAKLEWFNVGAVTDVRVDGVTCLDNDGVAHIPAATSTDLGVTRPDNDTIEVTNGVLGLTTPQTIPAYTVADKGKYVAIAATGDKLALVEDPMFDLKVDRIGDGIIDHYSSNVEVTDVVDPDGRGVYKARVAYIDDKHPIHASAISGAVEAANKDGDGHIISDYYQTKFTVSDVLKMENNNLSLLVDNSTIKFTDPNMPGDRKLMAVDVDFDATTFGHNLKLTDIVPLTATYSNKLVDSDTMIKYANSQNELFAGSFSSVDSFPSPAQSSDKDFCYLYNADGTYSKYTFDGNTHTWDETPGAVVPLTTPLVMAQLPRTAGDYKLNVTVDANGVPTYAWVAA